VVESLALSRPEVGFFLRSDGRRSLAFPAAADLRERISQVHGLSLARSLVALEDPVVWGFVSPLAVSFPTRRYLHVAVNGRVVEADSFAPAVAKAYADLLPKGRHPAALLRLELGPGEVDVNVHPAKSAVRLRGGRSAYPLVVGTIRSALAQEREVGGGAPPEEGSHGLMLIGQFASLLEAQVLVGDWRTEYNTYRLHSALDGLTPADYAEQWRQTNQPGSAAISSAPVGRESEGNL
jgi:DNA mismatch repair protein MutL